MNVKAAQSSWAVASWMMISSSFFDTDVRVAVKMASEHYDSKNYDLL